jgi:LacI family transcriptional regulator
MVAKNKHNRPANGKRKVTIRDVARHADVSLKTVSRVLNKAPHVRPLMVEKVTKAARELGFTRSAVARMLSLGRSQNLGIVLLDLPHWNWYSDVIIGVQHQCHKQGYTVSIHPIASLEASEIESLHEVIESGSVDGLVLTHPWSSDLEFQQTLRGWGVEFVCMLTEGESAISPSIIDRDAEGAKVLTQHLLDLGHRNFAIATGMPNHAASSARLRGVLEVLEDSGKTVKHTTFNNEIISFENGYQVAAEILKTEPRPTAVIAGNDLMAAGILRYAHEVGVRVPDEFSIVGYGDMQIANHVWPALTTMRQETDAMAARAAEILISLCEKQVNYENKVAFSARLVTRDSSGPAPA